SSTLTFSAAAAVDLSNSSLNSPTTAEAPEATTVAAAAAAASLSLEASPSRASVMSSASEAAGGSGGAGRVAFPNEFRRERRRASMQDAIDASKIKRGLVLEVVHPSEHRYTEHPGGDIRSAEFLAGLPRRDGHPDGARHPGDRAAAKGRFLRPDEPLLPRGGSANRKSQTTTKIHKRTLNPEFEEEFIFELKQQDINWSVLEITVFDYDPCSLDDCLGQVKLPLAEVDLSEKQVMWKGICSMEKDPDPEHTVGDLMFSMSYLPSAKRLSVSIMKARNLREAHKDKPLSDALVRVTLSTQHGKKQKKKKTSTCKSPNGNPSWEEALTFTGISEEDLAGGYLELVVCHDGVLTSTEVSRVYLGPDTSGEEYQHWWNMVKSKGAAAQWHKLHPVGQQK
ncbi:hypothetical protein BOX15_Mlig004388g2, partial [Macrostomum lignano]